MTSISPYLSTDDGRHDKEREWSSFKVVCDGMASGNVPQPLTFDALECYSCKCHHYLDYNQLLEHSILEQDPLTL